MTVLRTFKTPNSMTQYNILDTYPYSVTPYEEGIIRCKDDTTDEKTYKYKCLVSNILFVGRSTCASGQPDHGQY